MAPIPIVERLRILKQNEGWFGQAPEDFQDALLGRCVWRTYAAGQAVYRTSDPYCDLYGVVDGTVDVFSRFGIGDNPLLHLLHEGVWFGYGGVASGASPRLSVFARADTVLAVVPLRSVYEVLESRPEWWRIFALAMLEALGTTMGAYADMLIPENERRCACGLLRLTGLLPPRRSRPERAEVTVTQQELADLVNVSRTTLLQILRRFEGARLIEQGYRSVRILKPAELEAVARGTRPLPDAANGSRRRPSWNPGDEGRRGSAE